MPIHEMTVAQLKDILNSMPDTDVLVPNQVENIAIFRNGTYVGFIDFLKDHPLLEYV